jgi:hypothetical protein
VIEVHVAQIRSLTALCVAHTCNLTLRRVFQICSVMSLLNKGVFGRRVSGDTKSKLYLAPLSLMTLETKCP